MKIRFTKTALEKLTAPAKGKAIYWDEQLPGFGLYVTPTGVKTFFVQSRCNGVEVKATIGRVGIFLVDDAREKARDYLQDFAKGINPRDEEKRAKEKLQTVEEIFKQYCTTRKNLKQSTKDHYKAKLECYTADWWKLPLASIDEAMIVARHAKIGEKSKAQADHVMRVYRALFNFAIKMYRGTIAFNPVGQLSNVQAWYKVGRKQTSLKATDLKTWIQATEKCTPIAREYLLLLLYTGARATEAAALTWSDIDLESQEIIFRETKSGRPLTVPFSSPLLPILKRRQEMYDKGPGSYVFPSYGKKGHITDTREAQEQIRRETGLYITPHDLRRTFMSYAEECEISPYTIKRLCNHALPQDVTEGYLQFSTNRLRRAVEQVAAFITANQKDRAKVVPMKRAG